MGRRDERTRAEPAGAEPGLTHRPFAALRARAPERAAEPEPADAVPAESGVSRARSVPTSIRLAVERKGRAGKTITRVTGLGAGREEWMHAIRRAVGAGASLDGEDVVVQGDQLARLARWLAAEGVEHIAKSNR